MQNQNEVGHFPGSAAWPLEFDPDGTGVPCPADWDLSTTKADTPSVSIRDARLERDERRATYARRLAASRESNRRCQAKCRARKADNSKVPKI